MSEPENDFTMYEFPRQPETLVGCGCLTNWHRVVMRLNTETGQYNETRICGECGDARVIRANVEVTDEMRAQLQAMAEPDDDDDPEDMRRGDAWKQ